MKLQVKQLDELTRNRITRALNFWAKRNEENFPVLSSKYRKISHLISRGELILCEWQYDAPHDDVQVLGRQEKGGEQWN